MKIIKIGLIVFLLTAWITTTNVQGQSTNKQLDTCKREYIALALSYEDLKKAHVDTVLSVERERVTWGKETRKKVRKKWFNGFLWGGVVGMLAFGVALVR